MDIDKKEITQILMSFFQEEMAWEIMQCNPEISEDIKLATIKEIFDKYCTPKKRVIGNPETRSWGYDGVYNYNPDNEKITSITIDGVYAVVETVHTEPFDERFRFVMKKTKQGWRIDSKKMFLQWNQKWRNAII